MGNVVRHLCQEHPLTWHNEREVRVIHTSKSLRTDHKEEKFKFKCASCVAPIIANYHDEERNKDNNAGRNVCIDDFSLYSVGSIDLDSRSGRVRESVLGQASFR